LTRHHSILPAGTRLESPEKLRKPPANRPVAGSMVQQAQITRLKPVTGVSDDGHVHKKGTAT
jgi:hypothetical protein